MIASKSQWIFVCLTKRENRYFISVPSPSLPLSLPSLSFFVPESAWLSWPVLHCAGCTSGHRLSQRYCVSNWRWGGRRAGGPNPTTDLTKQTSYRATGPHFTTEVKKKNKALSPLSSLIYLPAGSLLCLAVSPQCEIEILVMLCPSLAGAGAGSSESGPRRPRPGRHWLTEPQF